MNPVKNFPRLATSCLLFDSPDFEKILLIEREQAPELGLWSFPGGKLEPGENIVAGMEREVYEETGYRVSIVPDILFHLEELKESNYLIITGMAFLNDGTPSDVGRNEHDLKIVSKFFDLKEDDTDSVWNIKDEECIECLKRVIQKFIKTYRTMHQEQRQPCMIDI